MKRNTVINRCLATNYSPGVYLRIYENYINNNRELATNLFSYVFAADMNANSKIYCDCLLKGMIKPLSLSLFFSQETFPSRFVLKRI